MAKKSKNLPTPDDYGNYWLEKVACDPAILVSGRKDTLGKFFVTLNDERLEVIADSKGICYFNTPEEAYTALKLAQARLGVSSSNLPFSDK